MCEEAIFVFDPSSGSTRRQYFTFSAREASLGDDALIVVPLTGYRIFFSRVSELSANVP